MRPRLSAAAFRRSLLSVICGLSVGAAAACELPVRDFAFRAPRDVHRLCLLAGENDAEADAHFTRLAGWLDAAGADLNVELVRLNVDDPNIDWASYGIPSAPPNVPVTVLVGKSGDSGTRFLIDYWSPAADAQELERLLDSPIRQRLADQLVSRLAVVLHSPCVNCQDHRVAAMLENVARRRSGASGLGIGIVALDRTDPRERLLQGFAGIPPDDVEWVAVTFGRGKLMFPPLVGAEITEARLNDLLDQVEAACSCSRPLPSMGVDIPMRWTAALDAAMVPLHKLDPATKPDVQVELTGLHPAVTNPAGSPALVRAEPSAALPTPSPDVRPSPSPMTSTFVVLGAMIVAVGLASRWMFSR